MKKANKTYLDRCFYCDESKEAIQAIQRRGDIFICGVVDSQTGELLSETKGGRHTFVVTDREVEARKAYELAEAEMWGDMVDFFAAEESRKEVM